MADDAKPSGEGRQIVIPRAKVEEYERDRERNLRADRVREPLSLASLYNSKSEADADSTSTCGITLKDRWKNEFRAEAEAMGMSFSEYTRRALMLARQHPSLLQTVDDLEAEYKTTLGPSRWHEP